MRNLLIFVTFASGMLAQHAATPAAPAPTSPVKKPDVVSVDVDMSGRTKPGSTAKPVSPDTVVATVGGQPYTAAEMDKVLADLPPQIQTTVSRDPAKNLPMLFTMKHLEQQAEFHNLDKDPQWRQTLEFHRLQTLANAEITKHRNEEQIGADQERQYYEANKDLYKTVKTKVIYLSFNPNPAAVPTAITAKTRTETEAKAKIDDLRKQALAGADFGKLAKENSDDKASAGKDGDFGEMTRTSPYPEPVRQAVFALKPGEVSEPVRQPNGFYLFKAVDATIPPFDKIQIQVHNQLAQHDFDGWFKSIQDRYQIKVEDPAYFSTRTAR